MKKIDRIILLVLALGMWFMGVVLMMPEKTEADVTPVMPDVGAWPFARRIIQDQNTNSYSKGEIDGITNGLNAARVADLTVNGALIVTNGSTVTAGGVNVTGNSTFTNDVDVLGTLTGTNGVYNGTLHVDLTSVFNGNATFSNSLTVATGNLVGNSSGSVLGWNQMIANLFQIRTNSGVHGTMRIINDTQLVYITTLVTPHITNVFFADTSTPTP